MAGITLTNSGTANTCDTMVARLSAGAPEIVLQPQSQTVSVSPLSPPVNATFSVTAWGAAPLNFRWWFNGTNLLAGATNAVLSFKNVQPTNAGGYSVILSNASGSLTSQVATLTVTTPPPITMQPQSQTVASGTNVFFSVTASGTQPLSYQWRLNGVNLQNIVITAAGNGTAGFSGDGGPATNASLSYPFGLATDAAGNLFIAEVNNNRIRRLATNGTISTVAGNGTNGYSGDGGPATNASFYGPSFVAVDGLGNVFISDTSNNRVRRVGVDGLIATVAGNGTNIYSGDGGAATNASLNIPDGLALDAAGNLFFAEVGHNRIRKVDTNGIITTVAGTGAPRFSGSEDGGPAASAKLNFPYGVALDPFGNLFIADSENYRVRRVGADGVISTLAGNGTYGFSGDGGPATNASMRGDCGVADDAFGNVFFSDTGGNNRVREVLTAQGPSLQLRGVALTNAGSYDVVVANTYGSVTSTVASLPIILARAITTQPQSQTVAVGTNATFSVGISGNFPSYQWWFNGTNRIAGATNSVLTISNAQPVNSGNYLVIVSNLLGAVTSQLATLSVETTFAQITNVNPVTDAGPASSAVWADYNNDGFLDVLIIGPSGNNYLYRNNGNGTFTVATNFASDACCANGAVWGDYDNDGNVDLFIANAANAVNYLYHNNGPPLYGFTRVIQGNLGTAAENSYSGAWGDYDNDGYLDLFVADRVNSSNLLYHNNRDGTFSRVLGAGIFTNGGNEPHSFSAGTAWADYDDDGWPDLFVANFSGQNNFLYHNNRDGTFTPVVAGSIVDDGGESHACAWGDYDNDGWPDLFVANHPGTNFLYRNNGDGSFTRVTNSRRDPLLGLRQAVLRGRVGRRPGGNLAASRELTDPLQHPEDLGHLPRIVARPAQIAEAELVGLRLVAAAVAREEHRETLLDAAGRRGDPAGKNGAGRQTQSEQLLAGDLLGGVPRGHVAAFVAQHTGELGFGIEIGEDTAGHEDLPAGRGERVHLGIVDHLEGPGQPRPLGGGGEAGSQRPDVSLHCRIGIVADGGPRALGRLVTHRDLFLLADQGELPLAGGGVGDAGTDDRRKDAKTQRRKDAMDSGLRTTLRLCVFSPYLGHSHPNAPAVRSPHTTASTNDLTAKLVLKPYQIACGAKPNP